MTGLEEPLGSRSYAFASFFLIALFFGSSAWGDPNTPCPDRLRDMVHLKIEDVSKSRTEDTDTARQVLVGLETEIRKRVEKLCPNHATCSIDELAEKTVGVVHEVLDENPVKLSIWRGRALFGTGLAAYLATHVWVAMNANSVTVAGVSGVLAVLGVMALTSSGASAVEPIMAGMRRFSYALDGLGQKLRASVRRRLTSIYWRKQGVIDENEDDARTGDGRAKARINLAELACVPHRWETKQEFLERCAAVIAAALTDLVPQLEELDFSEPQYSTWARVLFSRWYLNDQNRQAFRNLVMEEIADLDDEAEPGNAYWEKYERVVRAWTSPPIISRRRNHQL